MAWQWPVQAHCSQVWDLLGDDGQGLAVVSPLVLKGGKALDQMGKAQSCLQACQLCLTVTPGLRAVVGQAFQGTGLYTPICQCNLAAAAHCHDPDQTAVHKTQTVMVGTHVLLGWTAVEVVIKQDTLTRLNSVSLGCSHGEWQGTTAVNIAQQWFIGTQGPMLMASNIVRGLLCDHGFASSQYALSLVLQHLHHLAAGVALPLQGGLLLLALPLAPQGLLKVRRQGLRATSGIVMVDLAAVWQRQDKGTTIKENINRVVSRQCISQCMFIFSSAYRNACISSASLFRLASLMQDSSNAYECVVQNRLTCGVFIGSSLSISSLSVDCKALAWNSAYASCKQRKTGW